MKANHQKEEETIGQVVRSIVAGITGRDLESHHTARMKQEGKKGNAKNSPAALHGFLECHGKTPDDHVDDLFGVEFDAKLAKYTDPLRGSTKGNSRSLLGGLRDSYAELQKLRGMPDRFGDAVKYIREKAGMTKSDLAKAIGKSVGSITRWEAGMVPVLTDPQTFTRMEQVTGAAPGCLTARFYHLFRFTERNSSEFGAKIKGLMTKVYRLPYEPSPDSIQDDGSPRQCWSKKLRDEFDKLFHFKTAARIGNLRRTGTWTRKGSRCASAQRVRDILEAFFGYLTLQPSKEDPQMNGRGMAVHDLSLALLSDPILIDGWIEFARARTGCYTQDTIYVLALAGGLIRPGTGFLMQHPEFAEVPYIAEKLKKMPAKNGSDPWEQWCTQGHIEIGEMRKVLSPKVAKGRDPMHPIRAILDMEEPMDALMLFAERLEEALVRYPNPVDRAVAYRTLVLVHLLTCAPLRIGMYARLRYRRDNTGNLFQRNDAWWLRFDPIDFKNMKGVREEYLVPIPEIVWPYIEEYLGVHRPLLAGADTSDYFFRPRPEKGIAENQHMAPASLSNSIYEASRNHVPNCPGFGAHAFRHIVATSLILADPVGGPQLAAFALNDTIQTIMKAYGHLTTADKFKWWLKALAEKRQGFQERRKNA